MPAIGVGPVLLVLAVCLALPLLVQAVRRRDRRRALLGAAVVLFAAAALLVAAGLPSGSAPVVAVDAAAWLALLGVVGDWAWRRWGGRAPE